jgi:hypothetical protein
MSNTVSYRNHLRIEDFHKLGVSEATGLTSSIPFTVLLKVWDDLVERLLFCLWKETRPACEGRWRSCDCFACVLGKVA